MNRFLTAVTASALALTALGAPRDVQVTASLDSTELVMGSRAALKVDVSYPLADSSVVRLLNFPRFDGHTPGQYYDLGDYDLVSLSLDSAVQNERVQLQFNYTLQAFDPGNVDVLPFAVLTGAGDTVFSQILPLKVFAIPVDTVTMAAEPADGVVAANNPWHDYVPLWLFWVIAAIVVIAGAITLVVLFRKRKLPLLRKPAPVVIPPFELAMQNLEQLRREGLASSGQDKTFYTRLVDILRVYLHGRFGINAMEMTSTQIVKALRGNPDTRLSADQIKEVLRMADFVKFAKERPLADDNQRALSQAFDFVSNTKPVPPPPAPDPKKHATPSRKPRRK